MTETDKVVYRSTHPDVLAHWDKTASAEAQNAWRERVKDAIVELGFPRDRHFATSSGWGDTQVIGVEHPVGDDTPIGWKRHKTLTGAIVPDKRRAAGKRAAQRLASVPCPNPRRKMPGDMPETGFGVEKFLTPGIARYGDAVFVTWSAPLEDGDASNVDAAIWEPVRLSEYYAAREQHEEAKTNA